VAFVVFPRGIIMLTGDGARNGAREREDGRVGGQAVRPGP
jgi:hypothetical protein